MKFTKNNSKGITLIALVVTIIVLLILAGVVIAMLTGDNSIINQAQSAKAQTEQKEIEEKGKLLVNYARSLDDLGVLTKANLETAINNEGYQIGDSTDSQVNCTIDGKEISITIPGGVVTFIGDNITAKLFDVDNSGTLTIKDQSLLASTKNIVIPSSLSGKTVTKISDNCFKNTQIESVSIPASVTTIGASAFSGCSSLEDVTIPCNVSLNSNSFSGCSNVNKITVIPSTNSTVIPTKNTAMPWYQTTVGVEIDIASGISAIGFAAFADGGVDNINHITSVTVPGTVKTFDLYVFSGCSNMTSIELGEGIEDMGGTAFFNCTSLQTITIPSTVTNIGSGIFGGCTSLQTIIFKCAIPNGWTKGDNCPATVTQQ